MVSRHGAIAPTVVVGRPLVRRRLRAILPAVAAVAGLLLLARSGPGQYSLVAPALGPAVLIAVVIAGWRIVRDRSADLACWSVAAGAAVLLGLCRVSGPPSGTDPSSAVLFPAAMALLAMALLTLPHRGVTGGQSSDGSWSRLACDALVAGLSVLFFAGQYVLVPDLPWASHTPAVAAVNVAVLAVLAGAVLIAIGQLRATGGPPLECVLALAAGAVAVGVGDIAFLAHTLNPVLRGHGHPVVVPWRELGSLVALLGIAGAALVGSASAVTSRPSRRRELLAALSLLVPPALVIAQAGYLAVQGRTVQPVSVVAGLGMMAALLVRYAFARLDYIAMSRTLEAKVEERTLGLVTREQWFRSLVQNSSDVLTVIDVDGVVHYQSPAMTRVFGHDPALLVGTQVSYLMRPTDARRLEELIVAAKATPRATYTMEFALWHREGRWCDTETTITSLLDDRDIHGLVLNTRDISERKRLEDALTHQAFHDTLTGLANRALFQDRVGHALRNTREPGGVAVLFLDLDGFKGVNDTQGHAVGDVLLGLVAERLKHCIRPSDTVARLGGDEFAVLVEDPDCARAAVWVAERVVSTLGQVVPARWA